MTSLSVDAVAANIARVYKTLATVIVNECGITNCWDFVVLNFGFLRFKSIRLISRFRVSQFLLS